MTATAVTSGRRHGRGRGNAIAQDTSHPIQSGPPSSPALGAAGRTVVAPAGRTVVAPAEPVPLDGPTATVDDVRPLAVSSAGVDGDATPPRRVDY